ncbi:MAG: DoxX family membrane protein [Clostridia bacterium]|nr:DoxX family membrane protein [Clostridia bacterium]
MIHSKFATITGWVILALTLFSALLISFFVGYNLPFLALLLFTIVLVLRYRNIFDKRMLMVARIFVGLLFLFSGFSKGVDPLGTAYRIEDYFIAFGTDWMMPSAVFFSFLLNTAELLLGGFLIFNIKPRITAWLVLLIMLVFTIITFNDAINNPVPDCGCFGDALIMSNWQTFYKNIVIMALVLLLFINRNQLVISFRNATEWTLAVGLAAVFITFQFLNYINLPMMDFRSWKIGNRIYVENPLPVKYYLTYRDTQTGQTKEYISPDFPYNDSVWMARWEFVGQRVEDPNRLPGMDLAIINFEGEDVTGDYLQNPDYHFITVAWDLKITDRKAFQQIYHLYQAAEENGYGFIVLTATLPNDIQHFLEQQNIPFDIPFFNADDITLKTMIRANPGLILIKDGAVIDKWHNNHLPSWVELNKEYLHQATEDVQDENS